MRVLGIWVLGDMADELAATGAVVDCAAAPRQHWAWRAFRWSYWLEKYLRKHQIEAVIEHGGQEGHVAWACAAAGVGYMTTVIHSAYVPSRLGYWRRRYQHGVFFKRYRWAIAVSDSVRAHEIKRFGVSSERIRTIPNGIVVNRFGGPRVDGTQRGQLFGVDLADETLVVGTVGNLRAPKNHEMLLRAWALLRKRVPLPAHLVIIGGGPLAQALEEQRSALGLDDCVTMLGKRSDVPTLLKGMDVFVMSSHVEGHPVVALEAMAAGLPIVGTRVSGLQDVIEDGVTGLLAEPNDAKSLASQMTRLINDAALRHNLAEAGREMVEREYSIERCAQLHEQALRESNLA